MRIMDLCSTTWQLNPSINGSNSVQIRMISQGIARMLSFQGRIC